MDIPLAVSLAGFPRDRSVRAWVDWAADEGFRGVAIDGAASGTRARELDRSARRDLAALLRRRELSFAGIDLWIPAAHFKSAEHQDRAIAAALGAIDLARELASLGAGDGAVVSMTLPDAEGLAAIEDVRDRALTCGVTLADHAWPAQAAMDGVRMGFDPATVLLAGANPAEELPKCSGRLECIRLSDANESGRASIGAGRLDLEEFRLAMLGIQWHGPALVDARGLADAAGSAAKAATRWCGPA